MNRRDKAATWFCIGIGVFIAWVIIYAAVVRNTPAPW
jgi:hypothetical protein